MSSLEKCFLRSSGYFFIVFFFFFFFFFFFILFFLNSYDDPTYIPDPTDLGRGSVSVGLGHDSKRESNSAYVDGYIQADLAAVLQDPVIRSMSRPQVEKAVEQAKRNMNKAAADLDFLAAAKYRDEMWALQQYLKVWKD
jgi:excinuclease ABC subunit B